MMDGADLAEGGAEQTFDENGNPSVSLKLKSAENLKKSHKKSSKWHLIMYLVIWMDFEEGKDSFQTEITKPDPKFVSAPTVNEIFNQDTVSIVGSFHS